MDRCRLKGMEGDQVNAILSAAGMNFGKLLKAVSKLPSFARPILAHLFALLKWIGEASHLGNHKATQLDPGVVTA